MEATTARATNEERKFVSLLSSRLKKEKYSFDETELDEFFDDALTNLPDSVLKTGLKKHYDLHLKKLKSILLHTKKPLEDSVAAEATSHFNFYNKDEVDRILEKAKTSKSKKEKDKLYNILWSCFPIVENSQKILESLHNTEGNNNFSIIEKCLTNTIGCLNKESILKCLKFLLSVFSAECETSIVEIKSSKCKDLQGLLLQSVMLINHRWKSFVDRSTAGVTETPGETYEDLMAAMLSLYVDILLVSSSDDGALENLPSLLFIILGHSPEHCMDVLLQVTQPFGKLVTLARCILERNKGKQSHIQYIKFICLSRAAIVLSSLETLASVRKVAESQQASTGFVGFLFQSNKRLAKRLGLTRKMNLSQVTANLLADNSDNDMEALLDIATGSHNEDSVAEGHEDIEMVQGDEISGDQLFFIDSSGGLQDIEQNEVQVEKNKAIDSILYKQMKSMAKQSEVSDSEEEEDTIQEPTSPITTRQHEALEEIQETKESQETEQNEDKKENSQDVHETDENEDVNQNEEEKDNKTTEVPLRKSTRLRTPRKSKF